ncbi:uncharacterized protein ACNS7B_002374 isoform 2-T2 [Menidia menidia]
MRPAETENHSGYIQRTKMSLILILMLHFTAAAAGQRYPTFLVKAGDEVSLPCKSETNYQQNCSQFTWLFNNIKYERTKLFEHGKIQPKSDRLTVTEDCSLVIKEVTDLDVGRYTCREFRSESGVFLSVVHMTEHQNKDSVTIVCSVLEHGGCWHNVEWLQEDGEKTSSDERTQSFPCFAALTFPTSDLNQKSDVFKCKVTNRYDNEEKLFPFSLRSSGGDETPNTCQPKPTNTEDSNPVSDGNNPSGFFWWHIFVSVCLVGLLLSVISVNVWAKTHAKKTQKDQNTVLTHEGEGTVIYNNIQDPSVSIPLH